MPFLGKKRYIVLFKNKQLKRIGFQTDFTTGIGFKTGVKIWSDPSLEQFHQNRFC